MMDENEQEVIAVYDEKKGKMKYIPKADLQRNAAMELLFNDDYAKEMQFSGIAPELDTAVAQYTALQVSVTAFKTYRNILYMRVFNVWFSVGELRRVYDNELMEVLNGK